MKVRNYNGYLEFIVGFGLKDVAVETSLDGAAWTALGDFTFNQGDSAAGYQANTSIDFQGAVARYVRLTVKSSYGSSGMYGLSEVRFLYIPTYPRQPDPNSGETGVDTDVVLAWRAGRDAASHDLYLGPDRQAVLDGTVPFTTLTDNRFHADHLELGRTYWWKVDEVNTAESVASWTGEVWSFSTLDFYLLDDFESYNDDKDSGTAVYQTWDDGFVNGSGSQAGHYPEPFMERTLVHQGLQSMPFYYNNTSYSYSEVVRTFETPQDWTRGGAQVLVLYFQGLAENTPGRLYVKVNGTRIPYDGDETDLTEASWIRWAIDLARVPQADLKQVRTLGLGVDNGGNGTLFIDDVRLYRTAPQ